MTVVVGFAGPDGAVMASDTEATEADQTRRDMSKIWRSGGLLFGYTGTTVVSQPLRRDLDAQVPNVLGAAGPCDRHLAATLLPQICGPVLARVYSLFVPPTQGVPDPLRGILMALGRDDTGYWLLEVDQNNGVTQYADVGFHAVGSGSLAAQTGRSLLAHYEPKGRPIAHLRLLAHRTVQNCIDVLGGRYGVGGRVEMWHSENQSDFTQVGDADLARIADGVEKWTTIERESMGKVALEGDDPVGLDLPAALDPSSPD